MTNTIKLACLLTFVSAACLTAKSVSPEADDKYLTPVKICLDNLIECGTDTYGPVK